jgi:hypothetical protein
VKLINETFKKEKEAYRNGNGNGIFFNHPLMA